MNSGSFEKCFFTTEAFHISCRHYIGNDFTLLYSQYELLYVDKTNTKRQRRSFRDITAASFGPMQTAIVDVSGTGESWLPYHSLAYNLAWYFSMFYAYSPISGLGSTGPDGVFARMPKEGIGRRFLLIVTH